MLSETAKYISKVDIRASLEETLDKVNAALESHEKMSNIVIVADEWAIENELLTPTLKLKRSDLEDKYKQLLSQIFPEKIAWES